MRQKIAEYEILYMYQKCIHWLTVPPSLALLAYKGNMHIVYTSAYLTEYFQKLVGDIYPRSSVLVQGCFALAWINARCLPKLLCHSPPQLDRGEEI